MARPTRIHADKTPQRTHFIAEWAEKRSLKQADLVRATGADKATVSRWFGGAVPHEKYLAILVEAFQVDSPSALFLHPDDDWLARFFRDRNAEERQRVIDILSAAFPKKVA